MSKNSFDSLPSELASLLEYVKDIDNELCRSDLIEWLEQCISLVNALEDDAEGRSIVEIRCLRCDRRFRSLPHVEYCTQECELGQTKMPYQTRGSQADYLLRAMKGRA